MSEYNPEYDLLRSDKCRAPKHSAHKCACGEEIARKYRRCKGCHMGPDMRATNARRARAAELSAAHKRSYYYGGSRFEKGPGISRAKTPANYLERNMERLMAEVRARRRDGDGGGPPRGGGGGGGGGDFEEEMQRRAGQKATRTVYEHHTQE